MSWEFLLAYYGAVSPPESSHEKKVIPSCDSPDDVMVYISPWVANAYAVEHLGPVSITLNGDYPLDEGLALLEKKCRENAFYIGANAVINFTCEIYLWEKPTQFQANGSRCVLKFQT
jgi:hypothetical protein